MSTGNTPPEQPNYEVDLTAWVSMAVGEMNRNMPSPISRAIMPFARLSQLVRERDAAVRRETIEECAKVCDANAETYDTCSHESSIWACGECAASIRAMQEVPRG
jgi:hypothetical protein